MEKVFFHNSKGLRLVGMLHIPKNETKTIIVMAHGFTGDKDEWGRFVKAVEEFCRAGFAVFRFDFSGSGESDDTSLTVEKEVDDLRCALEYVKNKGFSKIGLLGFSLGGLICARVCTPEIGTMVLWAPLTARLPKHTWRSRFTPEQLRELKEKGYITKTRDKGVRKRYIIDAQILRDMESVNQRELLSKLKCPVLIIHGSKDDAVSIEDSKNALKYLPQGSKLEVILGGEHKLSNHLDRVISLSLNWFRRYLSGSCVQQRE